MERFRAVQERLGRVYHQPVSVASQTNKRVTVNFRAPSEQVQRLLPPSLLVDEVPGTGMGMVSMCACDFWVTRIGVLPVPRVHNNEMLLRVSARLRKRGEELRAYYTIRSDASSRLLGLLGGRFSHFRKAISRFTMQDDEERYALTCEARDPTCGGELDIDKRSISREPPSTTLFPSIQHATDFVLNLDGSCGYHFPSSRLSFQSIRYPKWDTSFVHRFEFDFRLVDYLLREFEIDAALDSAIYMEDVPQEWGASWLYPPDLEPEARKREEAA